MRAALSKTLTATHRNSLLVLGFALCSQVVHLQVGLASTCSAQGRGRERRRFVLEIRSLLGVALQKELTPNLDLSRRSVSRCQLGREPSAFSE